VSARSPSATTAFSHGRLGRAAMGRLRAQPRPEPDPAPARTHYRPDLRPLRLRVRVGCPRRLLRRSRRTRCRPDHLTQPRAGDRPLLDDPVHRLLIEAADQLCDTADLDDAMWTVLAEHFDERSLSTFSCSPAGTTRSASSPPPPGLRRNRARPTSSRSPPAAQPRSRDRTDTDGCGSDCHRRRGDHLVSVKRMRWPHLLCRVALVSGPARSTGRIADDPPRESDR
jgi:hypothetical protein